MNTDTPRTDEVAWPETGLVEGDFARQLERELTAARAEIDRLKDHCRTKVEALQNQTAERMKAEQQRIAIADAAGFIAGYSWSRSDGIAVLPDYLNDLNAMHDAEKMLEADDNHAYGCYCIDLQEEYGNTVHLTAAQRAEAFLRTIGKWTTNQNEL
jgi:hypothetical protein